MKPLLITAGDPGGIGYELVLKALPLFKKQKIEDRIVIIGNKGSFKYYSDLLKLEFPENDFQLCFVGEDTYVPTMGKDTAENGKIAIDSLDLAIEKIKNNESSHLLTGPISKKSIVMSGKKGFTGHTTYLAKSFNTQSFTMVLANPDFAVGLVTIHHPLKQISNLVDKKRIRNTIENMSKLAKDRGEADQKLWLCALNPHAGEDGELGNEEKVLIIPYIKTLQKEGFNVSDPLPADSLFKKAYNKSGKYFIAMYHDQGLIPVKMLGQNKTVNMTLGLPFFRISVEHGTAYDICGQNKADLGSFLTALDIVFRLENF